VSRELLTNQKAKMPAKDMKQFLHDFFNPPKFAQPVEARRRPNKKKVKKKTGPSPIQRQLMEADEFMKYKVKEYDACETGKSPPPRENKPRIRSYMPNDQIEKMHISGSVHN
jgi:hypothetical protein